jgi:NAD(P)-dependent dehydrogenase (short-subunit alcohol dehydrogenase family)
LNGCGWRAEGGGVDRDHGGREIRRDDEFDRIINVNLRGVWNCMKAEL